MTDYPKIYSDIPTTLRFVAISLIVAGHFELFEYGGGGAYFLMVMVGYNIATFKLNKILTSNSVLPIAIMIVKVMIPCMIYTLLLHIYYGPLRWQDILMVSNFTPNMHPNGFSYWFIEVYIQLQVILLVILSIKPIRKFLLVKTNTACILFTLASCAIFLLSEAIWDADHLMRRVPWLMLWLVAFGCSARFTESTLDKSLTFLGFVLMSYIVYGHFNYYLILSYFLLIIKIPVVLPKTLMTPIYYLAAGSLFIYLTHFQVKSISEKIIGNIPLVSTFIALLIGASLFHIYNKYVNKPGLKAFNDWRLKKR
ncbi:hypothetical protein [Marinagarivorans algicola]|uniref:hypothetical protein n=1 Tax=Marinagarivorans algicola TaxID=1513270 RepID=UPI0037365E08